MLTKIKKIIYCSFFIFIIADSHADSGVALGQTRIIYNENNKEQTITIINNDDKAYLVQAGVYTSPNGQLDDRFHVIPPLFRLEPNKENTIRIILKSRKSLANNKESIAYFSANVIPSSQRFDDNNNEDNSMQAKITISTRSVIKLFYRPNSLSMSYKEAEGSLKFKLINKNELEIYNPSPYYLTFASLKVNGKSLSDFNTLISPEEKKIIPISDNVKTINWSLINDFGGISDNYHYAFNK